MWFDRKDTLGLLHGIVAKVTTDPNLKEDLVQEALIHLWLQEECHPANTLSWYLQSCYFHLANYVRIGRSLDSAGRPREWRSFSSQAEIDFPDHASPAEIDRIVDPSGDVLSAVAGREIVALLSERLSLQDKEVFSGLVEGLPARRIASKLKLSHTAILKRRQNIAAQARRLGLVPEFQMPRVVL